MCDWDEIFKKTKKYFSIKENSFYKYVTNSPDTNKLESFKSELLFAFIFIRLQEKKPLDIKIMKQVGENHPDLKLKVNGKVTHVEVTKITKYDNRFREKIFDSHCPQDVIEQDKVKLFVTSKLCEKSEQFKKWISKGIIKDSDSKIIAIDMGQLFPACVSGSLLFAAYNFFKDELELNINQKTGEPQGKGIPIARNKMQKLKKDKNNEYKLINIVHDDILHKLIISKITGIIAYHSGIPESIHIISINNDPLMDMLYSQFVFTQNMDIQILRHGITAE
ncbi:TPA: hypothetical protein SMP81_002254 [Proteus mirabilis]|uniref:hypothetical protein n=1 Tax=Proteus mirabilis TaxID=584 RepID=UPI0024BAD10B|nr:hypothetical protein [Proteus mirabilis]HEK0449059.1 hypothetical protein [Proteus mirabilis]HEK0807680.1 hypothetical protein [Proteus mirabilis]HEK2036157.1 hypothetical protein [Proteus mirabilis]